MKNMKENTRDRSTVFIKALSGRAGICNLLGKNEEALSDLRDAIRKGEELGDPAVLAGPKYELSAVLFSLSRIDDAAKEAAEAMELFGKTGDKKGEAQCLSNIGYAFRVKGEFDKALEYYERSIGLQREVGDRIGLATNLNNIGRVHSLKNDNDKALEYFENAFGMYGELNYLPGLSTVHANIGFVLQSRREYAAALEHYEKGLAIQMKIGDVQGQAFQYNNMAYSLKRMGKSVPAGRFFRKALDLFRKTGYLQGVGMALHNIAGIYADRQKFRMALSCYEEAVRIFNKVGDSKGEAMSAFNAALNSEKLGDLRSAEKSSKHSLELCDMMKDAYGTVFNLNLLAGLLLERKDLMGSAALCEKAISLCAGIKLNKDLAIAKRTLGNVRSEFEDYERAEAEFRESIEMFSAMNMTENAIGTKLDYARMNIRRFRSGRGTKENIEEAMAFAEEALVFSTKGNYAALKGKAILAGAVSEFEKMKTEGQVNEKRLQTLFEQAINIFERFKASRFMADALREYAQMMRYAGETEIADALENRARKIGSRRSACPVPLEKKGK